MAQNIALHFLVQHKDDHTLNAQSSEEQCCEIFNVNLLLDWENFLGSDKESRVNVHMIGVGLLEQNFRFVDVSEKMRNLNVGDRGVTLLQIVNSALANSRFVSGTHVR